MPTVREAAYRIFAHFGIDRLFGNPGSTELPMLKAMPEGFRYVLGLNEAVTLLEATLKEEKATDEALTQIAESAVNVAAEAA